MDPIQKYKRRSRVLSAATLTRQAKKLHVLEADREEYDRPVTRGDCENDIGPCPWVSCKYNLYMEISDQTGSIKLNFPDKEPWEMTDSCALEVADRGGVKLREMGDILGVSRERVRQMETRAIAKLKAALVRHKVE